MEGTANLANLANQEEMKTGDDIAINHQLSTLNIFLLNLFAINPQLSTINLFRSSSKDSPDSPDSRGLSLFTLNHQPLLNRKGR